MVKKDDNNDKVNNNNYNYIHIVNDLKDLGLLQKRRKRSSSEEREKQQQKSMIYKPQGISGIERTIIDNSPQLRRDVQQLANERSLLDGRLMENDNKLNFLHEQINQNPLRFMVKTEPQRNLSDVQSNSLYLPSLNQQYNDEIKSHTDSIDVPIVDASNDFKIHNMTTTNEPEKNVQFNEPLKKDKSFLNEPEIKTPESPNFNVSTSETPNTDVSESPGLLDKTMMTEQYLSFMNDQSVDKSLDTTFDASGFIEDLEKEAQKPGKTPDNEHIDLKIATNRSAVDSSYQTAKQLADILNALSDEKQIKGATQAKAIGINNLEDDILKEIKTKQIDVTNPDEKYKSIIDKFENYLNISPKHTILRVKIQTWNNLVSNLASDSTKYQSLTLIEGLQLGKKELDTKIKDLKIKLSKIKK